MMIKKLFYMNAFTALFLCYELSANEMDEPMLDSATIPPHIATMRPEALQAIFPSLEQPQVSSGSVPLYEDALPTLRLTTDSFMTEALSHRAEWKSNLESLKGWEQFAESLASRLMKANYSGVTLAALQIKALRVSKMADNIDDKTFLRKLRKAYHRIYVGKKPSAIPLNNKERQRTNGVTKFTSQKPNSLRPLSPTLSFETVVQELGLDLESVGDQPSYGYDELANMLGVEI
jgi:hypothetical protein